MGFLETIFLPGLAIVGIILLVIGVADRGNQLLAVGGCVLLGSVLVAASLGHALPVHSCRKREMRPSFFDIEKTRSFFAALSLGVYAPQQEFQERFACGVDASLLMVAMAIGVLGGCSHQANRAGGR